VFEQRQIETTTKDNAERVEGQPNAVV
jgi:hypothetical protein